MVAADMLQLGEVVTICGEFLQGQMDATNCVGIYQFLEQIACMELLEFTENYIFVHFLEVRWCEASCSLKTLLLCVLLLQLCGVKRCLSTEKVYIKTLLDLINPFVGL